MKMDKKTFQLIFEYEFENNFIIMIDMKTTKN